MWVSVNDQLPPEGQKINTKIVENGTERMEQVLYLQGKFWWEPAGYYVYYSPTHWFKK